MTRPRRMLRNVAAAGLLVAAAFVMGWASDSGPRTVTVTRTVPATEPPPPVLPAPETGRSPSRRPLAAAAWIRAADRACADAKRAGEELLSATGLDADDPRIFDRLADVQSGVLQVHERWLSRLRARRPGKGARDAAAALEANVSARMVLVARLQAALSRHDAQAAQVLTGELYRLIAQGRELRSRHGFAVCGSATASSLAG